MSDRTVVFRKSGTILEISLTGRPEEAAAVPEQLRRVLEPQLSYRHKRLLYGPERRCPVTGRMRKIEITDKQLYRYDRYGRLITNAGFTERLTELLKQVGCNVLPVRNVPSDKEQHRDSQRPNCYRFDMAAVTRHFQFRERQQECLQAIFEHRCGVVHAVTGFGKLVLITMVCLAFPEARIHICTRRATLVRKIHAFLTRYLPDVGLVGDGSKDFGRRITVFTAGSLHHADYDDCDILLCDEAHELLAENASACLARYEYSRNYAFTATTTGRLDGTDMRMEALFGRTIFYLPYWEAVELKLVSPIRVEWTDVKLDFNPVADKDGTPKKRHGLWRNRVRNQIIADKALTFDSDDQVLILVDTVEHVVHLGAHLPGYTLVYGANEVERWDYYIKNKLIPADMPVMTPKRIEALRDEFEVGTLKKVIATGIWAVGIDPVYLTALIRGSASSSEIMDVQAPGRVSRRAEGKDFGVVCDFRDQFDTALAGAAKKRFGHYKAMRWEQVDTNDITKPLLRI